MKTRAEKRTPDTWCLPKLSLYKVNKKLNVQIIKRADLLLLLFILLNNIIFLYILCQILVLFNIFPRYAILPIILVFQNKIHIVWFLIFVLKTEHINTIK